VTPSLLDPQWHMSEADVKKLYMTLMIDCTSRCEETVHAVELIDDCLDKQM